MTTKILVLSSNPHNTEQLGLNREFSEIENARESSRNKDQFTVLRVAQARVDHLQREILETKARIVHFCGHGLGNQGLVLETKDGQQQLVSTEALADLFKLLAHQVECVILNACYSEAQAAAIDQHINYVIGTNNAIKDNVAIAFSQGFYTGLFSGKAIEDAYKFAKNRIQLEIYDKPGQQRKLTVINEGIELPAAELFTFKIKNPLNQIESEEATTTTPPHTTSNLIPSTAANFIGREKQLEQVHQLLQNNEQVSISAIAGMGGIGKTELAIQYALNHQEYYPGSIGWFSARGENLGIQIIEFARSCLKIFPPEQLDTEQAKLNYCWQHWHEPSLIILDDVPDYGQFYQEKIKPYLPPGTNNIKVLMTSREHPGSIAKIDLDVLEADQALELLQSLIGKPRIDAEPEKAQELCAWLGYLPLGIELVGLYIAKDGSLTIERTLKRLERKKLQARALLDPQQTDNNAQLGVASAFDLSWDVLTPEAQELGCYLSLFTAETFRWLWVETAWIKSTDEDEEEEQIEDLEQLRNIELSQRSLLKGSADGQSYQYQLHSLIAQYFRAKLEAQTNATELKQKFCSVMNQIAQTISDNSNLEEIQAVTIAIPHLSNVATELTKYIDDENIIWSFLGLGRFYLAQGIYHQAEQWWEQCLIVCQERLGEQHPDVATSLNNLAMLYCHQGRYEEAEPLYIQSLELYKQLLGKEHPDVALSFNNLAELYRLQGKYEEAECLYLQSLELRKQLLGEEHPDLAQSLNNLAALYHGQGRYEEAEPLYIQSLELYKQLLGKEHPSVALSLNNLAELYRLQRRYEEAEPLYIQSLELSKKLLGKEHPHVALSLNNLAELYRLQGRYEEAKPLYIQSLELSKQLLGEEHPHVATSLNNLALLYYDQGRYEEAEPLYIQSLKLRKQLLGEQHPHVAQSLNNLALLYYDQGRYEEAEPLYIQSLELSKQLLGEEHPHVATSLNNLALLYYDQGRYEDAEPIYLQALVIAETALGKNHPNTKTIQDSLNYLRKIKQN